MTYDQWITSQAAAIEPEIWRAAREGRTDVAVYAMPGDGRRWGRLVVADDANAPEPPCDVVRFPGVGARICAVPMSALASLLWHACRSLPVCGEL